MREGANISERKSDDLHYLFKTYDKSYRKQERAVLAVQHRQIDQQNRIQSQEIVPHINDELIFDNDAEGNSVEK